MKSMLASVVGLAALCGAAHAAPLGSDAAAVVAPKGIYVRIGGGHCAPPVYYEPPCHGGYYGPPPCYERPRYRAPRRHHRHYDRCDW